MQQIRRPRRSAESNVPGVPTGFDSYRPFGVCIDHRLEFSVVLKGRTHEAWIDAEMVPDIGQVIRSMMSGRRETDDPAGPMAIAPSSACMAVVNLGSSSV